MDKKLQDENKRLKVQLDMRDRRIDQLKATVSALQEEFEAQKREEEPAADRSGGSVPDSTPDNAAGERAVQLPPAAPSSTATAKERYAMTVEVGVPDLHIEETVHKIDSTSEKPQGRVAMLIAEGFFDHPKPVSAACAEMRARGWGKWTGGAGAKNMGYQLTTLATMGFLRRNEDKSFVLVAEAKKRITRHRR